jgi:hypothetical protein
MTRADRRRIVDRLRNTADKHQACFLVDFDERSVGCPDVDELEYDRNYTNMLALIIQSNIQT